MYSSRKRQYEIDVDEIDPNLLDDPAWQEAMQAAMSPPREKPRVPRVSPSANAGAASYGRGDFYCTGGLSEDEDLDSSLEVTYQPPSRANSTNELPGRSERTNPSRARPVRSNPLPPPSSSSSMQIGPSSTVYVDSDDEILILDDVPVSRTSSTVSAQGTKPPPPSIDLDYEYALQLQKEMENDGGNTSIEVLDFPDDVGGSFQRPLLPTNAPLPNRTIDRHRTRADQPRSNAPSGPQRGAFGVVQRHGNTSSETVVSAPPTAFGSHSSAAKRTGATNFDRSQTTPISLSTSSDSLQSPFRLRSNDSAPVATTKRTGLPRNLPPISRTTSTPISPAHMPPAPTRARHRPSFGNSTNTSSPNRGFGSNTGANFQSVSTSAAAPSNERWLVGSDDEEDEARLRSGVATRRRQERPGPPQMGPLSQMGLNVFDLVNRRPSHRVAPSPGLSEAERAYMIAIEADLQEEEEFRARLRQAAGTTGRRTGRATNRRGDHGDAFEVDTNDYEAMLRLSERNVKRGASAGLIKSLPIVKSSHDDCTICQGTADTVMIALPCLHNFHKECILPHLKTSRLCPNCRHEIE